MRPLRSFCGIAAVLCGSAAPLAYAQTPKEAERFGKPLTESTCLGRSTSLTYPFSLARLTRATQIEDRKPSEVYVLVVDNGFIGYRDNEAEEPPRVESDNFPVDFFQILGARDFVPYLEESEADSPPDKDVEGEELVREGHGTHVAGIVLGGMYEKGQPKEGGKNLLEPDVRRLLLFNPDVTKPAEAKPWIKMRFVRVRYGSEGRDSDPVDKLRKAMELDSGTTRIVNMSLTRTFTSMPSDYKLPLNLRPEALVLLAAGNATMRLSPNVRALPAQLDQDKQLLVVASHDADGQLSHFSNYGERVSLAAPGCKILSWLHGDGEAVPLSGTSMATAFVSFAASLVRSRWSLASGGALGNRLLASAHFEPQLLHCDKAKARTGDDKDPSYCVEHGARLDIETALLVSRDFIEYDDCPTDDAASCARKSAVGTLVSVPERFTQCIGAEVKQQIHHGGLTRNGAVKRTGDGQFLIVTESGTRVGGALLSWKPCAIAEGETLRDVVFIAEGEQFEGKADDFPQPLHVKARRVHRIVTRALQS